MNRPTPGDFEPFVGKAFRVAGSDLSLTLTSVERSLHETPYGPSFLLIFAGPPEPALPEGMRAFSAGDAAFAFYVVPVHTPARDRQDYQVVFD